MNDGIVTVPSMKSEAERKLLRKINFPAWTLRGRKHSEDYKAARDLCIRRYRIHLANGGLVANFRGDVYFCFETATQQAANVASSATLGPKAKASNGRKGTPQTPTSDLDSNWPQKR